MHKSCFRCRSRRLSVQCNSTNRPEPSVVFCNTHTCLPNSLSFGVVIVVGLCVQWLADDEWSWWNRLCGPSIRMVLEETIMALKPGFQRHRMLNTEAPNSRVSCMVHRSVPIVYGRYMGGRGMVWGFIRIRLYNFRFESNNNKNLTSVCR